MTLPAIRNDNISYSISPSPPTSRSSSSDSQRHQDTLHDQLHFAYARDDIHTAKIILLRLRGVVVTDHDDPRIASVQPEDFDECFLPVGGLMTGKDDWKPVEEMQARERARLEELTKKEEERREQERRTEWEKQMCTKWQAGRQLLREARLEGSRKAEHRRRLQEEERHSQFHRRETDRRAAALKQKQKPLKLSYASLSPIRTSPIEAERPLVYSFMMTPSLQRRLEQQAVTEPVPISPLSLSPTSPSPSFPHKPPETDIPFTDVLASMSGTLFPLTTDERMQSALPDCSQTRKQRREAELLDHLLEFVKWEEGERGRLKGKGREIAVPMRRNSAKLSKTSDENHCVACSACTSPTSPTGTSSSAFSRSGSSWFWNNSSSSISTAVTTPSSPSGSRFGSWLKGTSASTAFQESFPSSSLTHSCQHANRTFNPRTPIAVTDGPLLIVDDTQDLNTHEAGTFASADYRNLDGGRSDDPSSSRSFGTRVSRIFELARDFQNAYVGAVVFGAISSQYGNWEADTPSRPLRRKKNTKSNIDQSRPLNSVGYRARVDDVATFLGYSDMNPPEGSDSSSTRIMCIPLILLSPPSVTPQKTTLPNPLPYPIVFKPQVHPAPSPLKRFAQLANGEELYEPPSNWLRNSRSLGSSPVRISSPLRAPVVRQRCVPNPVFLRLKALQNIVGERGFDWEGRGREGMLSCGREKLISVAYEDAGRSLLAKNAEEPPDFSWSRSFRQTTVW